MIEPWVSLPGCDERYDDNFTGFQMTGREYQDRWSLPSRLWRGGFASYHLCAESPGMKEPDSYFISGDRLCVDERQPLTLMTNARLGLTVPDQADQNKGGCATSGPPWVSQNDAIFNKTGSSAGSIMDEFRKRV